MVIALIAFLTKDWQYFFVYLNLVTVPICVGFMLFLESPRWLVASNRLEQACEVHKPRLRHLRPTLNACRY